MGVAFVQEVAVEGADGEDFGVPVVEGVSFCQGEFAGWETLHARSAVSVS